MTERSKKLVRQYKRYLGDQDSEALIVKAAEALRAGTPDAVTEEQVRILGNFSPFIDAVENSYAEYEDRLKIATRNIELSSKELTTAYAAVENLNLNINAMLDSLGQGLLFFDANGTCSPVFSKACLELLDVDPSHKYLPDILDFSNSDKNNFSSWLAIVFSDTTALDFDDMKNLLPSSLTNSEGRHIDLDYRPMYLHEGGSLMGVLLIATDITYRLETEQRMMEIQREAYRIQQIAQNRNGFHRFLCDIYNFLNFIESLDPGHLSDNDRVGILRQLHTFKGHAGAYSLDELSGTIHEIEDALRNSPKDQFLTTLKKETGAIAAQMEECKNLGRNLFGSDFMTQGRILNIEAGKLDAFMKTIDAVVSSPGEREKLQQAVGREFLSIPLFSAFLSFERELSRVSEQMGKPIPLFETQGENIPIIYSDYEDFFNVLIHLARNIIDHGIENPQDRTDAGKPAEGLVVIKAEKRDQDRLRVTISDDGRGIDPDKVRNKLTKLGVETDGKSDEEIIQHIFLPDFSLKTDASMMSGRGIGMNAIFDVVEKMGGNVRAQSGPGQKGSSFIFELPYRL